MPVSPSQRKRRFSLMPLVLTLLAAFYLLTLFNPPNESFDQEASRQYYLQSPSNLYLELPDFPLVIQSNHHSSSYAVISMVSTFLGQELSEEDLMRQFLRKEKRNMYPASFLYYLKVNLKGYQLSLLNPTNQESLLGLVISQLSQGMPVPVLISSTNHRLKKKKLTLNYAVITGIDRKNREVIIATTFGFVKRLGYEQLMDSLDHRNLTSRPLLFSITESLQLYHINNVYRITPAVKKKEN